MLTVKLSFRDGTRPLAVVGVPTRDQANAIVWNANKDPNVTKCDILGNFTPDGEAVIEFKTGKKTQ